MDFCPDRSPGHIVDRFNFNRANWTLFKDEILNYCNNHYNDDMDIEQMNKNLSECIIKSALKSIPKFGEKSYKYNSYIPPQIIY